MKIPYYRVHAFTTELFTGNPAGVCLLENWVDDRIMQKIAFENNLAETAFIVKESGYYHIRWFTPAVEVDLCGHATLASGYILFEHTDFSNDEIEFKSKSGILKVEKRKETYTLNFPVDRLQKVELPGLISSAFKEKPVEVYKGNTDYLLVFANETMVRNCNPDLNILKKADGRGVIVTSRGEKVDFVSRFFAPQSGIDEDPVTGSAHTSLVPYWSDKLNKSDFIAHQLSSRGGELICRFIGNRVEISGKVQLYMSGYIHIL